jgi:hypothetical protein
LALVRESAGRFELVINEQLGDKGHPFNILLTKTNRGLKINKLTKPVLLETLNY